MLHGGTVNISSRSEGLLAVYSNFVAAAREYEERVARLGADVNALSYVPSCVAWHSVSGRAPGESGIAGPERRKPEPRIWSSGFRSGTD